MPKQNEKPEGLEDLLKRFEELHAEEKRKEAVDLATRIDKAITKAIDGFLIKEHGADENGVPLHYHLGDPKQDYKGAYEKTEELIHQIGLATLPYLFPKLNRNQLAVLKAAFEKERYELRGMLAVHGFNVEEFQQELMNNKRNIFGSEEIKRAITRTAHNIAAKETSELMRKIFHPEHQDELVKYTKSRFAKEGYEIKAEALQPQQMAQHLSSLYISPDLGSTYLEAHKKYIKKIHK